MQRDRLEGWMVTQIEQADLARETVIQLPVRASTAPVTSLPVGTLGLRSPRRGRGRSSFQITPRPQTTPSPIEHQHRPPLSPSERIRHQRSQHSPTRLESATAALDDRDSVARQWRHHFQDPTRAFREDGKVDRAQVLRSPPRRRDDDSTLDLDGDGGDRGGGGGASDEALSDESLMAPWGVSREYILEYIRQSVMPTAWTTNPRFTGEWEAVPPSEADGRYAASDPDGDAASSVLTSLPPLSKQLPSPVRSPRAKRLSTSPPKSYRRPHPGTTIAVGSSTSPRLKPPRSEERIHRVLAELRADPTAWEAFQNDVQQFLHHRKRRHDESNKIRENKQRASFRPHAPAALAERKRRRDERVERTQRHRQILIHHEERKLESLVVEYRRRTQATQQSNTTTPRDVTTSVAYRRRKMWLLVVAFSVATSSLQQKWHHEKQRQIIDKIQTRAARVIQRLWKKWKWRHASRQTIVVYTWLRKCLWKLLFKLRCRRRRRHATLLQRFLLDQCSGSRETRNFNRMMLKWRSKVIVSQRLGLAFVHCCRARLAALAIWWDTLDHERQRSERQSHDRHVPLADEKEAEWHALVGSSTRGRLAIRRPSTMGVSSRSLSIAPPSSSSPSETSASPPSTASASNNTPVVLSRRTSVSTRQLLDQIDERLTTLHHVLTPIEIQRLQQHACHVVKIPKQLKLKLLQELLTSARRDYIRKLTVYQEQIACATYAREVKLDDARAIVQGSGSSLATSPWPTTTSAMPVDAKTGKPRVRKPVFQLFTGENRRRAIEELIRRGVQLTLESDPDQRAVVERQRHQRLALEAGGSPPGSVSGPMSARKRESGMTPSVMLTPQPPSSLGTAIASGSEAIGSRIKSNRKLTFAVPATIREKPKRT